MKARRRSADDVGFTLIELLITITIMGVITLPLGNFVIAYFTNLTQTQGRLSDSHDVQIATGYFSRDVQDMTKLSTPGPDTCGSTLGTATLLIQTDDWTAANGTGADTVHYIAYIPEGNTLHRVYCASGSAVTTDATVVHNYVPNTLSCAPACTGTPPTLKLTLSISSSGDTQAITLTGQRRLS